MSHPPHSATFTEDPSFQYITVSSASLAYLTSGSSTNPPLILCHGHLSDLRSFSPLLPHLTSSYYCITYSRRYSHPSSPFPTDSTADDWHLHASDLAELIRQLPNVKAPVHVLGNSSGGAIALLLAKKQPELVKSLILVEPALPTIFYPRLPPPFIDVLRLAFRHPLCFIPVSMFGATLVARCETLCKSTGPNREKDHDEALDVFGRGAIGPGAWDKIKDDPRRWQQVLDNKAAAIHLFSCSTLPAIMEAEMRRIQTPALMMTGEDTIEVQKLIDWKVSQCLGPNGCKEVRVEGAGHFMHEDRPEEVAREVKEFLEGLKGKE